MKNSLITLLLCLLFSTGFSQTSRYEYTGRLIPSIKKEKLNEAVFISEIMPEFSHYFVLPFAESALKEYQRILIYPQEYLYPRESYSKIIDFVSVEIFASCNGKDLTSVSSGDTLSREQKNILNSVDLGTEIRVNIKFKYKNQSGGNLENAGNIITGEYAVKVVPETNAEYPGGFEQITEYLKETVINKIYQASTTGNNQQATVKFTVNEEGRMVDAKIFTTSKDPIIDQLLLDAANKMPKWKPAENPKGIKVKQVFSIPFGGGGC